MNNLGLNGSKPEHTIQGDTTKAKVRHKLDQKINDKAKHIANMITDGFRRFFLGTKKEKDGSDLVFYGEDDDPKNLNQWDPELPLPQLPLLPDEKLQLKEQVNYLEDRNKTLENKNTKLEGELSAYRQTLKWLSSYRSEQSNDKK